jgi:hypothetical protein
MRLLLPAQRTDHVFPIPLARTSWSPSATTGTAVHSEDVPVIVKEHQPHVPRPFLIQQRSIKRPGGGIYVRHSLFAIDRKLVLPSRRFFGQKRRGDLGQGPGGVVGPELLD